MCAMAVDDSRPQCNSPVRQQVLLTSTCDTAGESMVSVALFLYVQASVKRLIESTPMMRRPVPVSCTVLYSTGILPQLNPSW